MKKRNTGLSPFWNILLWIGAGLIVALPFILSICAVAAAVLGVIWLWGVIF